MSEFHVDYDALDRLQLLLNRAAADAGAIKNHLAPLEHLKAGGSGHLDGAAHTEVIGSIMSWMESLGRVYASTSTGVDDAARYYREADEAIARDFDSTEFPAGQDMTEFRRHLGLWPIDSHDSAAQFNDVGDPRSHVSTYVDPGAYEDESRMSDLNWYDAFSISAWANSMITEASQVLVWLGIRDRRFNPLEELFRPFVGDWSSVRATSEALSNVSLANHELGLNVRWAGQGCEVAWVGNAGNSAARFLLNSAKPPTDSMTPLAELSAAYLAVTNDMIQLRTGLVGLYGTAIDTAVEVAIAGAVAGGATASGVGAPVGGLAALYAAYKASRLAQYITQLLTYISALEASLDLFKSMLSKWTRAGLSVELPPLPDSEFPPSRLPVPTN
ncbi:hypothetical protein [Nocardioides limicola]|uniref:hypothetical protein n=1 Tax=Nocardioides limicola TaxID=2803368 RepID=UPI00193C0250|nr:hypothetical protein [Nocardioides sp. DJM-14]